MTSRARGLAHGVAAYGIWGLFPLYWKLLAHVPALQVMAHRIVWSSVALELWLEWRRRRGLPRHPASTSVVATYAAASVLIAINWFLYVWAVSSGRVLETSLGYFLTPLVSVVFGVAVFRESLRLLQWLAVGVAAAGMAALAAAVGGLPWVSAGLAASFSSYSVVKKRASLPPIEGLALETRVLSLPALAFLLLSDARGDGAFLRLSASTDALLAAGGLVTIVPLVLFASSLRLVPLTTVGILQYLSPSLQFVLGVALYHEPFGSAQLLGFGSVWVALVLFAVDGVRAGERPGTGIRSET
jgi:chloramphenicol-sensitive protein RarD